MKRIIAILLAGLFAAQLHAQTDSRFRVEPRFRSVDELFCPEEYPDSLLVIVGNFITPVVFDVNRYDIRQTPQLDRIADSIGGMRDRLAYVWIGGSASPEGPQAWNRRLGRYRTEALADYILQRTGLPDGLFRLYNREEDWISLEEELAADRDFPFRERILRILAEEPESAQRKRRIQELDSGQTWLRLIREVFPPLRNTRLALVVCYPKQTPVESADIPLRPAPVRLVPCTLPKVIPAPGRPVRPQWKIAAKTNLLFDAALVANLGVEISPWRHWSLDIPVWYSPYDITPTRKVRLLATQPEIRWWPGEAMAGHFVGLHAHVAGFNLALDDYARYQDPNRALWGLGLSYGYAMQLGRGGHWGMEFNIGAGFARYSYDAYRNWADGPKFRSGTDCYWGITRAGVTLSYKWELARRNRKN